MKNKLFGLVLGRDRVVIGDFKEVFIDNMIMDNEGEYERFKEECFKGKDVWYIDDMGFCEGESKSEVMGKLVDVIG